MSRTTLLLPTLVSFSTPPVASVHRAAMSRALSASGTSKR